MITVSGKEAADRVQNPTASGLRMRNLLKRIAAALGTQRPLRALLRLLVKDRVVIFMMHRFRDPRHGVEGHDPDLLRRILAEARREGIPLLSLRDVLAGLDARQPFHGLAFTVDDGYDDFRTMGAPVFAEFDCPVTAFLPTGFIDGLYWFWWDRLQYALRRTRAAVLTLPGLRAMPLEAPAERELAASHLVAWVTSIPESERAARIEAVLARLDVPVPTRAPASYAPLTWPDVRRLSRAGADFAPHTVTHPSLADLDTWQTEHEVRHALQRLREEVEDASAVLCYPYGRDQDVSMPAVRAARAAGALAAVTAMAGSVDTRQPDAVHRFLLPRHAFPDNVIDFRQVSSGLEVLKDRTRAALQV